MADGHPFGVYVLVTFMTLVSHVHLALVPPRTPVLWTSGSVAAVGSKYEFHCNADQSNAQTITYRWYKYSTNKGVEDWESKGPIGTSWQYNFHPVTEKHVFYKGGQPELVRGKYMCRASNSKGTRDSEWKDLYVYKPCTLYSVRTTQYKPPLGSKFTLLCDIPKTSGSTVQWMKMSDDLSTAVTVATSNKTACSTPPGTSSRYTWNSCQPTKSAAFLSFNLQVTNVQTSDSGYWICSDSGLTCKSKPVEIKEDQVQPGKPQITGFPSGPLLHGTVVNLKCVASPPGETYDWYKDNKRQLTSLTYDFIVRKERAGVYKCVAGNGVGSVASSYMTLTVYYKPDSVVVSSGKTSSHVGEKDKFTCTAIGGNPTPTLKIYFKRSGGTPVEVIQGQERVMAKEDNQAEYYCEATVPGYPTLNMRPDSKTYSVTFNSTKITMIKKPLKPVIEKNQLQIVCETDSANPAADIEFYRKRAGENLMELTSGISSTTHDAQYNGKIRRSTITITANRADNQAEFQCQVKGGSTAAAHNTVTVYYPPDQVVVSSGKHSSYIGDKDNFTCTARGAMPTTILKIYFKRSGGTPVEVTQGQEKVMVKEDNQATYYCEATVPGYPTLTKRSYSRKYTVTFSNTKVFFVNKPTAAVEIGQMERFECETDESNPSSNIEWSLYMGSTWSNRTTGLAFSGMRRGAYGGMISSSNAFISATKAMDGAKVRCTSIYGLRGHEFTTHTDIVLNVNSNTEGGNIGMVIGIIIPNILFVGLFAFVIHYRLTNKACFSGSKRNQSPPVLENSEENHVGEGQVSTNNPAFEGTFEENDYATPIEINRDGLHQGDTGPEYINFTASDNDCYAEAHDIPRTPRLNEESRQM